jgi:hypothetical protein
MNEHEVEENSDVPQACPSDEQSDDDDSLDSKIASRNQYYGRWAAEKWLLRAIFAVAAAFFCRGSDR